MGTIDNSRITLPEVLLDRDLDQFGIAHLIEEEAAAEMHENNTAILLLPINPDIEEVDEERAKEDFEYAISLVATANPFAALSDDA